MAGKKPPIIIHTADLHLRDNSDERWRALLDIVQVGQKEGAQVLTISGDLFHEDVNAEKLKPELRKIFSGTGMTVLLLPGNHDSGAYVGGSYLGDDIVVLDDFLSPWESAEVCIWGFPFQTLSREEILARLMVVKDRLFLHKYNILLYHGELLDSFFSRKDWGDEGEERYMPLKLSYFRELGFSCVLAGHFHSKFGTWRLPGGGHFVYPGSPVSITRRETGKRAVCIYQPGENPYPYFLDSHHYQEVVVELDPMAETDPVVEVEEKLRNVHSAAGIILVVSGFLDSSKTGKNEEKIAREIKDNFGIKCLEICLEFRDVRFLLEDSLFQRFMAGLDKRHYPFEVKKEIRDLALYSWMGMEK